MKRYQLLSIIACFYISLHIHAQSSEIQLANTEVPTPEVAALGKFIDIPVGHFTGAPATSIPIYTLVEGPLQLPISVNNHGSGIRAAETASWVGLGWSLNAGGVISRVIQGLPDETPTEGYLNHSRDFTNATVLDQIADGITDGEPDLFSFSFPGGSGKFIINRHTGFGVGETHVRQFPHSDLKIETHPTLEEFIITTTDGTRYFFGERNSNDYAGFTYDGAQGGPIQAASAPQLRSSSATKRQTEWYLRKIESHNGQFAIDFNYRTKTFGVVSPTSQQIAYVYSAFSSTLDPECSVTNNFFDWLFPFFAIGNYLACQNSSFSAEGSFGPSGIIENAGFFQILPAGNLRTTHPLYANYQGYESKLISSITTSTTIVSFTEDTQKRKDVNAYPYGTSIIADEEPLHDLRALKNIEIKSRYPDPNNNNSISICKQFTFSYDYFKSFDTPYYTFDHRLKLNAIQEKECGQGGTSIPPYTFQYYKDPGKTIPFVPWRLTKAVDAWGYYNGVTTNDNKKYNIPEITLSVAYPSSSSTLYKSTSDAGYGVADRNSVEAPMLYGALKRINYPEGGYTALDMEANTVKQLQFDTILGAPSSPLIRLASCSSGNTQGDCCPDSQNQETYTFSQQFVDRGQIRIFLNDVGCEDDVVGGPDDPPGLIWTGTVTVALKRASDNLALGDYSFSAVTDDSITVRLTEAFPDLLSTGGDTYIMTIQTGFCYGKVQFFEEQYEDVSYDRTVGGLRIKGKKTYDSNNNLLLAKSYTYESESDPTLSSGKLYSEPVFAGIINTGQIDEYSIHTSANYYYLKLMFSNTPYIPLSDFQGYHIGYEHVKETQSNGAYTKYRYNAVNLYEEAPVFSDPIAYPFAPFPYFYDNGDLEYTAAGTNTDQIQSSAYARDVVSRTFTEQKAVRIEKISSDNGTYELLIPNIFSYNKTGFLRQYSSIDTIDGVISNTTYDYDPSDRHLNPISTSTTNSDGTPIVNHIKYPYEAQDDPNLQSSAHAELIARNILAPIEQTEAVDGAIVKGSRRIYNLFSGDPYVGQLYNYEVTWDENGTRDEGSGPWQLLETVNTYNFKGQPTQVTRRGWDSQYLYWNASNHLLDSMRFQDFTWKYDYYHSSSLLKNKTDIDGQIINYDYDLFGRLEQISARNGNVSTDFEYYYKGQNSTRPQNHTVTTQTITPDASGRSSFQTLTTYNYLDEIGRPVQTVQEGYSQNSEDIVTATEYDDFGRPYKIYEPFEFNNSTPGAFVEKVNWPSNILTHFTLTEYEESPLNRKIAVTPPEWHPTLYDYGTNDQAITIAGVSYPVNNLIVQTSTDPDGKKNIVYTDKKGRQLMTVRKGINSGEEAKTQYLYDDKDRVTHILPPDITSLSSSMAFRYLYDTRDRISAKRIPDQQGWNNYQYDDRDLVTYMQDPVMQAQGRWLHTQYDDYGREVETGLINTVLSINPNQPLTFDESLTKNYYDGYDFSGGAPAYYKGKLRRSDVKILGTNDWLTSLNFYDQYGRITSTQSNHHLNLSNNLAEEVTYQYDFADNVTLQDRIHTRADASTTTILHETHYDHSGRITKAFHQIDGGTQVQLSELSYTEKDQIHTKKIGGTGTNFLQQVSFAYLPNGFLKMMNSASLSGLNSPLPSCSNALPAQAAANSAVENNSLFYLQLAYDQQLITDSANPIANNGNISQMIWRVRGRDRQLYSYEYDYLDRLKDADYFDINSSGTPSTDGKYSTQLSYEDKRGNIATITRNSYLWDGTCWNVGQIDNLDFSYHLGTNRLQDIADNATDATIRDKGFKYYDTAQSGADYDYDLNGNMIYDPSKAMTIAYNHLNLPTRMEFSDCKVIEFIYDAGGAKLSKVVRQDAAVLKRKDYLGGIEYVNQQIEAIYHSEGRVYYEAGIGRYEYNLTDHLGNVRLSFTDRDGDGIIETTDDPETNEILSETHYYPFGMTMEGPWMQNAGRENPYLYNGKELNEEFGLNWLSYGAREYDPSIGRWMSVDPLAESYAGYSPYNYTMGNPIKFIDPDGMRVSLFDRMEEMGAYHGEGPPSTIVQKNEDGTYKVTGGENDGDTGVYLDDGKGGKGEKIGESLTPYSFFDDDLNPVEGAIIDLCSNAGQIFLNCLFSDDPNVFDYMSRAKGNQDYDYKTEDMPSGLSGSERARYTYRGSVLYNGKIVSARDIGNIGAGWISGRDGIPWFAHRTAANSLQTKQVTGNYFGIVSVPMNPPFVRPVFTARWYPEKQPTVAAQRYGYNLGLHIYIARAVNGVTGSGSAH